MLLVIRLRVWLGECFGFLELVVEFLLIRSGVGSSTSSSSPSLASLADSLLGNPCKMHGPSRSRTDPVREASTKPKIRTPDGIPLHNPGSRSRSSKLTSLSSSDFFISPTPTSFIHSFQRQKFASSEPQSETHTNSLPIPRPPACRPGTLATLGILGILIPTFTPNTTLNHEIPYS